MTPTAVDLERVVAIDARVNPDVLIPSAGVERNEVRRLVLKESAAGLLGLKG
jgi:hypothetical protein